MQDLSGRSVGRYRIVEKLGAGGMAVVYKAYDTRLERDVAVKLIRLEAFPPEVVEHMLKRFEREAKALARMDHPNIVPVYDYGEYEGAPYLVMRFVQGGTLKSRTGKPVHYQEAARLLVPIARALDFAHRQNIVHRDVKPANILLTTSGEPMLSDFGIAKILETGEAATLTGTGGGVGTPEYMAPEQWLNQISPQTDIYALGVVLYELVTGCKPYTADTPAGVLLKQASEPLPSPRNFVQDLPKAVEEVLYKALAKKPEERYLSMQDFAAALELLARGVAQGETATEMSSETPVATTQILEDSTVTLDDRASSLMPFLAQSASLPESPQHAVVPHAQQAKRKLSKWLLYGGLGIIGLCVLAGAIWAAINLFPALMANITQKTPLPSADLITPAAQMDTEDQPVATVPVEAAPSRDELKIAVLAPLSGAVPSFGVSTRDGVQMAIDEWNDRGGVLGKKIVPMVMDSQCAPDPAVQAIHAAIDDGVRFVIGEVCSVASIPVAEIANGAGVLQISPTSTNPGVTVDANGKTRAFVYRACFIDPYQGNVMARFAFDYLNVRSAFVLRDVENAYVVGLADSFAQSFSQMGGKVVGEAAYTAADTDFNTILGEVAAAKPEVIYLPDYYNIANLVGAQAKKRGIWVPFLGGDGWDSEDLDLKAVQGGYFTNHFAPEDPRGEVQEFVKKYTDRYHKPPDALAALAYDTANLMLIAIQKTGSDDPRQVAEMLQPMEFYGVTGAIRFDDQHNPQKSAVIMKVRDDGVHFEMIVNP
ncbi:MAG: ABC transporter substrate-binding protein [Anaerolineae bacterium]|nr:ABC transporter substrate-binding protein [Anaerolineae bacterium]